MDQRRDATDVGGASDTPGMGGCERCKCGAFMSSFEQKHDEPFPIAYCKRCRRKWNLAQRHFEHGADRLERASAANGVLVQLGIRDPKIPDVAKVMMWADAYAFQALENLIAQGWRPPRGA